jgi:iron complex transport system ATP-binding protein
VLLDAVDLRFSYRASAPARRRGSTTSSGARAAAIDGVSLGIDTGAVVGVLGPNGSGKTTLIKLLSGALSPAAGRISLDGQAVGRLPRPVLARRVAVVPQETHLAFDYTVLEIVLMGRYPRLRAFEIEGPADIASAMRALTATGTADLAPRPFPSLSGGEKQRVIIASALAQLDEGDDRRTGGPDRDPNGFPRRAAVLFLDEPTASLDLRYQLELSALLKRLNADLGLTMVLSTHDLRLAASLCSHVVLLANGRVLAEGTPAEMLTAPLVGELYGLPADVVAPILA